MGESLALLNAVIWALTGVVTKGVGRDVKPIHIVTTQVWVGFLFLIGIGLVTGYLDDLADLQIRSALYLAGGALVNTAGSLVLWQAISRSTVSKVYPTTQSIFINKHFSFVGLDLPWRLSTNWCGRRSDPYHRRGDLTQQRTRRRCAKTR